MKRVFAWAVVLLLAGYGLASAQQTTTGSISGLVVDTTGAVLPGVTVSVTGEQGTRTFVTGGNGRFLAPFLTPGRYSVRLELQGFRTVEQPDVTVTLGETVDLELTMQVGNVAEVVQVIATAPTVDIQSTTAGGVLDSEVLEHLPVGRNYIASALYLVPGVSSSGQVGAMNPSISGGSGLENQYVVDGVNITNTGYGGIGSYSIVFGSLGNGVTTDFIQETQVKTASFEAEYGQSTGGVVNVITKSGSNVLHGSVYGFARPEALESEWEQIQTPNGTVNTAASSSADVGVTAGGRLIQDRLFFFGAANPVFQSRKFTAPEGFPLARLGEQERERRIYNYAAKVTWQTAQQHRVDASFFGDPSKGPSGIQRASTLRNTEPSPSELVRFGANSQVVRYNGIPRNNWLLEASFGRMSDRLEERPSVNEWNVVDTTVIPFRRTGGVGFYENGVQDENLQYQVKSTHLLDTGSGGAHQIRYGVTYEDITYDHRFNRSGPTVVLANGQRTSTGADVTVLPDPVFGRIYRVSRANLRLRNLTTQEYLSFFVQDTWQLGRFTFRPGVRYEQQELFGDKTQLLCREGETRIGRGDGTGAPKPCSVKWDGNWAPRIGATYDVIGNGRSKVYANWGRFYAKIPNDLAVRSLSADAGVTRADYFDAALTQPVPAGVRAARTTSHLRFAGLHAAEFDPDSKSTYKDEVVAGFEFEVLPFTAIDLRYIYRDMPRILEDVGTAPLAAYFLDLPGLESVEYFITNPSVSTPTVTDLGARFEDPIHTYNAFEITLNRRLRDNWSAIASYRYSQLEGTFEGFYRNDNGQSDPAISSLFDFPTNDPSYTQFAPIFGFRGDIRYLGDLGKGPLWNDRPHQIKLFGSYIWNNLNVGVGIDASSGAPLTAMASNAAYDNSGEIPETPRGGGINTVDGFKERTPFITTVDLHLDYPIPVGGQRLTLIFDAFNLFNSRDPLMYDYNTETSFGVINPNGPLTSSGAFPISPEEARWAFPSFRAPRAVQLGARFEW
jgi:hypothetical protein